MRRLALGIAVALPAALTPARRHRRLFALGLILAPALVAGSGGCLDTPEPVGESDAPIIFGEPDAEPAHDAVVALLDYSGEYFCTGTLIADNVVLTAAHCFPDGDAGFPEDFAVFFGRDTALRGDLRGLLDIRVHPEYVEYQRGDIALIELDGAAPDGIEPIPHLPSALGIGSQDVGLEVVFSGFGTTEYDDGGTKLRVEGTIGEVCEGRYPCADELIAADAFLYWQSDRGGPCTGDSGGPAFIRRGREYVAGVTSYGDESCADYGVSTTVSAYQAWIDDYVDEVRPVAGGCQTAPGGGPGAGAGWLVLLLGLLWRRRAHTRSTTASASS